MESILICSYDGSLLSNKKQWTIGTHHSKIDYLIVTLLMSQAQTSMCCVSLLMENYRKCKLFCAHNWPPGMPRGNMKLPRGLWGNLMSDGCAHYLDCVGAFRHTSRGYFGYVRSIVCLPHYSEAIFKRHVRLRLPQGSWVFRSSACSTGKCVLSQITSVEDGGGREWDERSLGDRNPVLIYSLVE